MLSASPTPVESDGVPVDCVQDEAAQGPLDALPRRKGTDVRYGEMFCMLHAGRPSKPAGRLNVFALFRHPRAQFLPARPGSASSVHTSEYLTAVWRRPAELTDARPLPV